MIEYKKEITGMKEFGDEDILYCSEGVQEIEKQQEVKVIRERVKERWKTLLEPWKNMRTP